MLWLNEQGTKIPYRTGGTRGSSTDPTAWTTFDSVCRQAELYTGIAIAITHPYTGIDLDGCLDGDGELSPWAAAIVEEFRGLAYCEVSPSGTGLKLITRARKPDGARCVAKMGEGKCQVEIYDKGRFWAMTGRVWDNMDSIGDGSDALHRLCQRLWPAASPMPMQTIEISSGGSCIRARAADYIARCQNVAEGGRNQAAFSIAGNLWAIVGDGGERLTHAELSDLVRTWNAGNSPPLPEDELQRVILNGRDRGTPRGDKRPGSQVIQDYCVDIAGLLNCTTEEPAAAANWKPEPFPKELLKVPGLIGELVNHNLTTALYPLPELAMAGALALMSTVTGQKIADRFHSRPNLYLIALAPSGGGKDHSRRLNREILRAAGSPQLLGPERIGSHAGIITQMEAEPVTLFQIDEIGHMVAAMQYRTAPHLFQISSVLMQLYSSADCVWMADALGDRLKVKRLHYPNCVLYGSSVPDGFWGRLSRENLTGGLIGRCLIFEQPDYVPMAKPEHKDLPDEIIQRVNAWREFKSHSGDLAGVLDGSHPYVMKWTADAEDRLFQHAKEIADRRMSEEPIPAAIWSRTAEKSNKLAMLFAASRYDGGHVPDITLDDADLAVRLCNYLTRRMIWRATEHVAETQFARDLVAVQRVLESQRGQWVALSSISKQTRSMEPKQRKAVLTQLLTEGTVQFQEVPTGGRTAQQFRLRTS